jgi:hypothetical protein
MSKYEDFEMTMTSDQLPGRRSTVSIGAVIKRVNRRLQPEEMLKITRGDRQRLELGDYYIIDYRRNFIINKDVDPETVARELGVLENWETVVGE